MQAVDRMPVMDVESVVLNLSIINAITVFVQASPEFPSSTPFSSFFLLFPILDTHSIGEVTLRPNSISYRPPEPKTLNFV